MLTRKTVVLAKIEAEYGTDPTPAGTDAVLVSNPDIKVEGEMLVRDFVRESLSPVGHVIGKKKVTISFETELKGSGTAGTAPETGVLFQACGMDETVSASTSVTYAPEAVSTSVASCTLYVYLDGTRHIATGCRGTFSINLEAGNFGRVQWTFTGAYATPTDQNLPTTTTDTTIPQIVQGASFEIDGYAPVVAALTFDIGNTIAANGDVNSADGYGPFQITARDSMGSINPESATIAVQEADMTANFWDDWEAGQGRALTIGPIGSTAGNILNIDMPNVIAREMTYGDRNGVRTFEMPFTAAETGAHNDEITIVFS